MRSPPTPPINFVISCTDSELDRYLNISNLDDYVRTGPAAAANMFRADLCWCLQTFVILSNRRRLQVVCCNRLLDNTINVVHSAQLLELQGSRSTFVVCVQGDFPRRPWAHYHIVQNKRQHGPNASFVPLWIQPGLIKRDPGRQRVQTIAYAGQTYNGNLVGGSEFWRRQFTPHGLEFVTLPRSSWHDLSSVDVLIGVRSFDSRPHNSKPPSKLLNAWHAHIPFIGGRDSAFAQVGGVPGENYLLVGTAQDAVNAVLRLRQDADLYPRLVQNGIQRATKYTKETIGEIWEEALLGPIIRRYERWKSSPTYEGVLFNTMLSMGLLEHKSKQAMKQLIRVCL
jgi:hypothetical protein